MTTQSKGLKRLMEEYERALIAATLARTGGNQKEAARALGVLPTTLCEKIKRLGLRSRGPDQPGDLAAPLGPAPES